MKRKNSKKHIKLTMPTLRQIERVIFRTMRIEEPGMTKSMARKAAAKVLER
jgi:hypothetical protein